MAIATTMDGLLVSEVTEDAELEHASARLGASIDPKVYRLEGNGHRGYVAASVLAEQQDTAEFNEPSPLGAEFNRGT